MDMPNTNPPTTTLEALEQKQALLAEKCVVNHSCYFGATNDNYGLFPQLDKTRVCGIKLFMGSSTGNMLVDRMDSLRRIFGGTDMLIAAHCEDQETIRKNTEKYKAEFLEDAQIPVNKHPYIRSVQACYASSRLAVQLATEAGARLHVLHVSTARELSLFSDTPLDEHKRITAEACVAHLLFEMKDYKMLAACIKCNPAVKRQADRDAQRRAVVEGYHGPMDGSYCITTYLGQCPDDAEGRSEYYKRLRRLYDRGVSYSKLSTMTGIPYSTLRRIMIKVGGQNE